MASDGDPGAPPKRLAEAIKQLRIVAEDDRVDDATRDRLEDIRGALRDVREQLQEGEGSYATDGGRSRRDVLRGASVLASGGMVLPDGGAVVTDSADRREGEGESADERRQCPLCDAELEPVVDGLRCPRCDVVQSREEWDLMVRDWGLDIDEITATAVAEVPREAYEVARERADRRELSIDEALIDYTTIEFVWRHAETGEVFLDERD